MPSETSDNGSSQPRTPTTSTTASQSNTSTAASAAAAAAEPLPCPRCDSTNTKFCYYNNYNLAQPRHFCKSCRRYWTQGGALRNIPVGGGTRKSSSSSKRHRTFHSSSTSSAATTSSTSHSPPSSTSAATTSSVLSTLTHEPEPVAVSLPLRVGGLSVGCGNGENLASGMNPELNGLYMGLGGYGSGCGYGYGFYESGLGVLGAAGGKGGVLPYHAMSLGNYLNLAGGGFGTGSIGGVPNTWQLLGEVGLSAGRGTAVASGVVAGGLVDGGGSSGDTFLAISTPGDTSSK